MRNKELRGMPPTGRSDKKYKIVATRNDRKAAKLFIEFEKRKQATIK
jgi:hypothetical protein